MINQAVKMEPEGKSSLDTKPKKSSLLNAPRVMSVQYNGGCSVQWRANISNGRANISTVEVVLYSGGLASGQWRANISTVEAVQYSGGLTSVQ